MRGRLVAVVVRKTTGEARCLLLKSVYSSRTYDRCPPSPEALRFLPAQMEFALQFVVKVCVSALLKAFSQRGEDERFFATLDRLVAS
jgi:hypothetical protein